MKQQHPPSQFRLSMIASSSKKLQTIIMPPKLQSSVSKELPTSQVSSASAMDTINDITTDDSTALETIMNKIQIAQRTIDAISLRLNTHNASTKATTSTLETLEKDVQSVNNTVADLPRQIDTKFGIAYQDLRSEFSSNLTALGTQLATEISANRTDTTTCFKNHVTTITNLSDTVLAITKNLTVLQENTLSMPDIECLIVKKWEDELDPHIKSHYDFKAEASTRLDSLDTILQYMITTTLKTHPLLAGTTML
jgi:chromosome segregation ATPase